MSRMYEELTVAECEEHIAALVHGLSLCTDGYQIQRIRLEIDNFLFVYCRALTHDLLVADGLIASDLRPHRRGDCQ